MEDFPQRVAEMLESVASRVRSMTVDRIATTVRWIAVGPVLTVLGVIAIFFLLVGLFRIGGELVGVKVAYAIGGGLLLLAALFLWSKRYAKPQDDQS